MNTKKKKLKMTNCGALGCTNHSANNKDISFHQLLSKKEEIKKKWLHNLSRKFIPEMLSVCFEHFDPTCFKCDLQAELTGTKPRNILYRYYFAKCSSELAQLVSLPFSRGRSTRYSD